MKKENNVKFEKNAGKKKKSFLRTDGLTLSSVFFNLKKLFLPWVITAALSAGIIVGSQVFISPDVDALSAVISFNYDGIEKGLDPNNCEFDVNIIKNDSIISEALSIEGLSADILDSVQKGLFIDGLVSSEAVKAVTERSSMYTSSSISWTAAIENTSYHPTQYKVSFNYTETGLTGDQAASLLNRILECYSSHFIETYGYSETIANSVLSVDFDNYDYLIALDMYSTKLDSLADYIDSLSADDPSQFRSEKTGYSFSDISNAVSMLRTVDIDTLVSYILNNCAISDKDMILSYYNYRINNLERYKTSAEERLKSIEDSIKAYKKDAVVIYNNDGTGTSSVSETSDAYDNMFQQKLYYQNVISSYDVSITNFKDRVESIKKLSGSAANEHKVYVDERIAALTEKTAALTDSLKITADEYFENEKFSHAISVISPAEYSFVNFIKSVVNESMRLLVIAELLLLTIYLFISIIACLGKLPIRKNDKSKAKS